MMKTNSKTTWPEFTPTPWSTSDDKRRFASQFVTFVESGFPQQRFTNVFYRRLSQMFGHIAHYDRNGFYHQFFTSSQGRVEFIAQIFSSISGCGDPAHTWSDVEDAISEVAQQRRWLATVQAAHQETVQHNERRVLAALLAKYPHDCPKQTEQSAMPARELSSGGVR